jgi:hypothetical protein
MAHVSCVIITLLLGVPSLIGKPAYDEKKLVSHAKALDVAKLDSALPSQPLDTWLRLGPAKGAVVKWRASDCGKKAVEGEPAEGYTVCVEFLFSRADISVLGKITVGTTRKGIAGRLALIVPSCRPRPYCGEDGWRARRSCRNLLGSSRSI